MTHSLVDRQRALENDILKKMALVGKIEFLEEFDDSSSPALIAYKPIIERQITELRKQLSSVESIIVKYGLGEPQIG